MNRNHLHLVMPSLAENVGVARVAIAAFAGQLEFTVAEIEELKVAVSEAVTNIVIHAYPDRREPGEVRIEAAIHDGALEVAIADLGIGIEDIEKAREAAYTTSNDPDHLGLGFTFMENFMDRVVVRSRAGQGTRVEMSKEPRMVVAPLGPEGHST